MLAVALFLAAALGARADPTATTPNAGEGIAIWTFSNPANYTVENATLWGAGASLAWQTGSVGDTTPADFAAASVRNNVDLTTSPGDVLLVGANGTGPPTVQTYQPGPAQTDDTYLWSGGGGETDFGAAQDLF